MGMDLRGAGGIERFGVTSWRKVLELAHEYGWIALRDPLTGEWHVR